ncbi:hypothetical protein NMY22_g15564 [Coprinellus aureogranulatus]|nr:hypothetical protein NMY22_g15564 [Coprinellus aureogranulatus]
MWLGRAQPHRAPGRRALIPYRTVSGMKLTCWPRCEFLCIAVFECPPCFLPPSPLVNTMNSQDQQGSKTVINNRNVYEDGATHLQAVDGGHIVHRGDNMNVYLNGHSVNGGTRNRDDLFSLLNPITDASHTRNRQISPPNSACLEGTRKNVIKKIRSWADGTLLFSNPHIMWIYGYAGCGKSAIAQDIAEYFAREGRLAGSFFFFRGSGDRSRIKRFARTVASQIHLAIPSSGPVLESVVKKNPDLLDTTKTSLSAQFQHLVYDIVKAIKATLRHGPLIIVLDALDECEDHDEISAFIEAMIKFFDSKPRTPLRFLVTSRVENHIHKRLHSSKQVKLLNLVKHTTDAEIAAALDAAIAIEKRGLVLACDDSWPSVEDRKKLVQHIGKSFIFMTTLVKLLFDPSTQDGRTPMERLPQVLSTRPDFDDLYKSILKTGQGLPHFHDVITTIALAFEPLSIAQISDILDVKAASVANVLLNLHAIMHVPGDDRTPVTLCHTSLRDFLTSEKRSGAFFVSPVHHHRLAYLDLQPTSPAFAYWEQQAFNHLGRLLVSMGGNLGSRECDRVWMLDLINSATFGGGCTALEVASREKKWDIVRKLVNVKADVNVCFEGKEGSNVVTALHAACHHREYDMIYLLLENGADPNVSGPRTGKYADPFAEFQDGTPLSFASHEGDIKLVTRLLECGADPDLQGGIYGTALQAACCKGRLEVVNLLLEHGADPNLTEGGHWGSALHACAWLGDVDCAQALLEHKADPNMRGKYGDTPLSDACFRGRTKVAKLLLDFGADPTIRSVHFILAYINLLTLGLQITRVELLFRGQ